MQTCTVLPTGLVNNLFKRNGQIHSFKCDWNTCATDRCPICLAGFSCLNKRQYTNQQRDILVIGSKHVRRSYTSARHNNRGLLIKAYILDLSGSHNSYRSTYKRNVYDKQHKTSCCQATRVEPQSLEIRSKPLMEQLQYMLRFTPQCFVMCNSRYI